MKELIFFLIWLDQNYLYEDFDLLTPVGKFFIFFPWLIKNILVILVSPLLYIEYKITTSEMYIKAQEDYIKQMDEIQKMFNQLK
jgi:hypothetical protein